MSDQSELAQQCEDIESEWGALCRDRKDLQLDFDIDDTVDVVGALLAYITELKAELAEQSEAHDAWKNLCHQKSDELAQLKLQVSTLGEQLDVSLEIDEDSKATIAEQAKEIADLRRPADELHAGIQHIVKTAEEHGDNTIYTLADIKTLLLEIARLTRPVVQSEVESAKFWLESVPVQRQFWRSGTGEGVDHFSNLMRAFDAAQREKALLGEALSWTMKNHAGFDIECDTLFSDGGGECCVTCVEPPAHIRPILLQYAGSNKT